MNSFFNRQIMKCILCGKQEVADAKKESNWRCIEANGWPFYACPKEFPADNSSADDFKAAYEKALSKAMELLAARKCRHCGCTDEKGCAPRCFWIEWDLCSSCGEVASPVMMQLPIANGMTVLGALQLACRHPGFIGSSRQIVEAVARDLQRSLSRSPTMAKICEVGWHSELDAKRRPSKIILPRGRSR